jgi:hypothetical protein
MRPAGDDVSGLVRGGVREIARVSRLTGGAGRAWQRSQEIARDRGLPGGGFGDEDAGVENPGRIKDTFDTCENLLPEGAAFPE